MKKIKQFVVLGLCLLVSAMFMLPAGAAQDEPSSVQKGLIYNKPGVVFITNYYTVDLVVQTAAGYPELSGGTYEVTTGNMGSGFTVNPNGYILTNGHVVKSTEDELAYNSLAQAVELMIQDIVTIEYQKQSGFAPTQQEMDKMYPLVMQELGGYESALNLFYQGWRAGEIKMTNVEQNVFVQQGAFVSGVKIPFEQGMKAEIKRVDYDGFTAEGEVKGKDIALLKVNTSNMPSVLLGDSEDVEVGDHINVIGYPGVATFESFLAEESQLEPSMTSGIISAEKTMKDGTQIFQTDAAITHGNSGGPAFLDSGEVIGIASMVSIDDATGVQKEGFSYLRPIDLAKEFLTENNVTNELGEADKHYRKGLNEYWAKHYTAAIKEFNIATNLYPQLVDANDYVKKSEEAKSRGEEVSSFGSWWIWLVVILVGGFFFVAVVVVVIVLLVRKKKPAPEKK